MHFTSLALASLPFLSLVLTNPVPQPDAPAPLSARAAGDPYDLYLQDDDDHQVNGELEHVFDIISQIPDEVLKAGDAAKNKWLEEHGHRSPKKEKREAETTAVTAIEERELQERGVWEVTKCVGAIAAFIASNAIGAAKLLRIKKYIEALGGIRKSAELLLKASTPAERLREGGEFLALLAGEILGTSMVANNC